MSSNQGFPSGGKNNPGEQDFSLSDLLPDLMPGTTADVASRPPTSAEPLSPDLNDMSGLFAPSTTFKSPKKPAKKSSSLENFFSGWRMVVLAVLILFGIPLAIFGGFVLLANLGSSLPTAQQLAQQASTPLPTVFSVTPRFTPNDAQATATAVAVSHLSPAAATALAEATPAPQPSPAAGGNSTSCNSAPAFVGIAAYPCATTVNSNQNWNAFFAPVLTPLGQLGVHLVGNQLRYDIVSDDPAKVISHYSADLRGKGYNVHVWSDHWLGFYW